MSQGEAQRSGSAGPLFPDEDHPFCEDHTSIRSVFLNVPPSKDLQLHGNGTHTDPVFQKTCSIDQDCYPAALKRPVAFKGSRDDSHIGSVENQFSTFEAVVSTAIVRKPHPTLGVLTFVTFILTCSPGVIKGRCFVFFCFERMPVHKQW